MYTVNSASENQLARYGTDEELAGLFKSIGKVFKGAAKIVGKVAAPAIGFAIGGPALMAATMAASSPNQPFTGTGAAVSQADIINAQIQQAQLSRAQALQAQQMAPQFPVPQFQTPQFLQQGGLPKWVLPAGIAAAGGLALVLFMRK